MNTTPSVFSRHPVFTIACTVVLTLFLLVAATEVILGLVSPIHERGRNRHIELREHPPLHRARYTPSDSYMKECVSLTQKPYLLEIDPQGFIVPSAVHSQPTHKVVFLGGSTTECLYVEPQDRFPYRVGQLLSTGDRRVNSYNAGVSGNTTLHSLNALLNKILPIEPDVVVMMHAVNDCTTLLYGGGYWSTSSTRQVVTVERSAWFETMKSLKDLLIPEIYDALRRLRVNQDEFAGARGQPEVQDHAKVLRPYSANLTTFVATCRAHGITPVLMTQASRYDAADESNPVAPLFHHANQIIREVAHATATPLIDLAIAVPPDPELIYDAMHYNDAGCQFVAPIIADELADLIDRGEHDSQPGEAGTEEANPAS